MLIWPSRPELQAKGFLLQLQIWTAGDMDLEKNLYTDPDMFCPNEPDLITGDIGRQNSSFPGSKKIGKIYCLSKYSSFVTV